MKKFQPGKTYTFTFIGDSDSCVPCTIISRTAKMVTLKVRNDDPVQVKIHDFEGVDNEKTEYCYPTGRYSMAPLLGADKEEK